MCFLKTLKPLDAMPIQRETKAEDVSCQDSAEETQDQQSYLNSMLKTQIPVIVSKQDQMMFDLLNSFNVNNLHIQNLNEVL